MVTSFIALLCAASGAYVLLRRPVQVVFQGSACGLEISRAELLLRAALSVILSASCLLIVVIWG